MNDLINFTKQMNLLMKQSNCFTKLATELLEVLDTEIRPEKNNIESIIDSVNLKRQRIKNLSICQDELDEFLKLIYMIEYDKLEIAQGDRGQISDYIKKLETLKFIEKYEWIKDLVYISAPRRRTNEPDLKLVYLKFNNLLKLGENILYQEFLNIIKHYSSNEQIHNFFEFLINKFISDNEITESGIEENNSDKIDLFISNETIRKMEEICSWFLDREQQYELYDEKNEHCDINQKLRFGEIRNEFLKACLITYFKINSVDAKESKLNKHHQDINKLVKNSINAVRENQSSNALNREQVKNIKNKFEIRLV